MITQSELKRLFHYDQETGLFTRLVRTTNSVHIGDVAGTMYSGYCCIKINNKIYKAHRLLWLYMYGEWPKEHIDHINHDRGDNRLVNIREASRWENNKNASMRKDNTSGVTGVMWHKGQKEWVACISINKKLRQIFGSIDFFEAVCARKSAENQHDYHPNHGMKA